MSKDQPPLDIDDQPTIDCLRGHLTVLQLCVVELFRALYRHGIIDPEKALNDIDTKKIENVYNEAPSLQEIPHAYECFSRQLTYLRKDLVSSPWPPLP